jgi:hypothetical protein
MRQGIEREVGLLQARIEGIDRHLTTGSLTTEVRSRLNSMKAECIQSLDQTLKLMEEDAEDIGA